MKFGDEYSFEQKCNVASVVLNRINHYKFSDKMFEILTPDQFETISNGRYKKVKESGRVCFYKSWERTLSE